MHTIRYNPKLVGYVSTHCIHYTHCLYWPVCMKKKKKNIKGSSHCAGYIFTISYQFEFRTSNGNFGYPNQTKSRWHTDSRYACGWTEFLAHIVRYGTSSSLTRKRRKKTNTTPLRNEISISFLYVPGLDSIIQNCMDLGERTFWLHYTHTHNIVLLSNNLHDFVCTKRKTIR